MKILRYKDEGFVQNIEQLAAGSSLLDREIEERAREIVSEVSVKGDVALSDFTERFNGIRLHPEQFAVTQAELLTASLKADESFRSCLQIAAKNIEAFSKKSLRKDWSMKNGQGATVGEKFDPFQRVGIYIPGGTAPLVSTALMTIVLARVAGCEQIVVCTPCNNQGEINPALLHAIKFAGATEIYRLGGAQAIAAMALGTHSIRRVQKVFGPGNAYVVAAKRLLVGHVAIDLLPGPSEVLVLADESANPRFVAADLLAQAEHGSGSERVWLVTDSGKLLRAVHAEVVRQTEKLSRHAFIEAALEKHGYLIQVKSLDQAVQITNLIAPEHCEIMTRGASKLATKITTAGALFLGSYSPTVLGDYMAGPSHCLPTGGAGSSFAGLTVDQFQRRTSIVEYNQPALKKSLPVLKKLAEMEGLDAHGRSASIRLESKSKSS